MYIWTLIFVGFLCRLCGIIETPHDRSRPGVLYGLTVLDMMICRSSEGVLIFCLATDRQLPSRPQHSSLRSTNHRVQGLNLSHQSFYNVRLNAYIKDYIIRLSYLSHTAKAELMIFLTDRKH